MSSRLLIMLLAAAAIHLSAPAQSAQQPVTVNVENFCRAETDMQFQRVLAETDGVNAWSHNRAPTPLDAQNVIRMNRDTLYSFTVADISEGATVTMPEAGERYMSLMVINNNGYVTRVIHEPGAHELTMAEHGTPYVGLAVRTLVDASDEQDIEAANALQDKIRIEASSANPFEIPDYDMESYQATYDPLLKLAEGLPNSKNTFGAPGEVDPVRFVIGCAYGWGGLPAEEAYYLNVERDLPVGEYKMTVEDVPVDAFWSVTVYNKAGYLEPNELDRYSVNNISGQANDDGSFTIHLGGCEDGRVNCIPLTEGWNYLVRLYRPRKEILDGSWTFPEAKPVKD